MNQIPLPTQNGFHQRDVDGVLRRFFRSEMPDPWPEVQVPASAPVVRRRFNWMHAGSRLALAASILLMVFGYVALAGKFPTEATPSNDISPVAPEIGDNPLKRVRTPRGRDATMLERQLPGKLIIIDMQQVEPGKE